MQVTGSATGGNGQDRLRMSRRCPSLTRFTTPRFRYARWFSIVCHRGCAEVKTVWTTSSLRSREPHSRKANRTSAGRWARYASSKPGASWSRPLMTCTSFTRGQTLQLGAGSCPVTRVRSDHTSRQNIGLGRSTGALDAREPLVDECTKQVWLLVGQGVTRVVDHGERGVRVVVEEVHGSLIPDSRVQLAGHDQRRTGVRRPWMPHELPPLADLLERHLVDERSRGADIALIALKQLSGLDDEVVPELLITCLPRPDDHLMLRDVAYVGKQRADQRETGDLPRRSRSHGLRVVAAGRVPDEGERSRAGDLLGEPEQRAENTLSAREPSGWGPAHPGKVGIDPPIPRYPAEDRLEASLDLAMIRAGPVQDQHRAAGSVLDVADRDAAHAGGAQLSPAHRAG